ISPPGPPHRKKSFLTKFPGWDLDENLKPKKSPYRGAHCRGSAARQNEVGLAARAARWPGCLGCGSCSGLLCDGEPRQQPLADLGATSAQLKRRQLRSDIPQARRSLVNALEPNRSQPGPTSVRPGWPLLPRLSTVKKCN